MSPESWRTGDNSSRIKEDVAKHDRDLYSSDKYNPGLTLRMADMEKDMKGVLEREDKRSKKLDRIELAVWAAIVMAIVTILTNHLH